VSTLEQFNKMNTLKRYHYILSFIMLPACLLLTGIYGWGSFATFTSREGLNGSMYLYYRLSSMQYFLYGFIVTLTAFSILIVQIIGLAAKNSRLVNKTYWSFLMLITLLLLCEVFLSYRFVGKG
jgi:hypothetical protein